MYAVVGCSSCEALWVVETDVDSSGCPRCGRRHEFDRMNQFVRTESVAAAREGRAALLAARAGEAEAYARFRDREDVADAVEEPVVTDAEYLAGSGIDPTTVAAAGDVTTDAGAGTDRRSVVRAGVAAVEPATEDAVVEYATDHGVEAATARSVLGRMVEEGVLTEQDGEYRRL